MPVFHYDQITREEGLGHNHVECTFQDSDGFIWFGTRNGLCRYDGFSIRTYRTGKEEGTISGNRILSINEDHFGNLWLGTFQNGLNRFNRKKEVFEHFDESGFGGRINRITVLSDSSIWFSTDDGLATYLWESNSFRVYRTDPNNPNSLNADLVFDMYETYSGEIYLATWNNNIQQFFPDRDSFVSISYKRDPGLLNNYRKRIIEGPEQRLWVSAQQHGLACYDPLTGGSVLYTEANSGLNTDLLNGDLMLDHEGNIWISTDGFGINILNPVSGEFSWLKANNGLSQSLPGNQVYSIYQDNQNHIWIGFYDRGVIHYDPLDQRFDKSLFAKDDLSLFLNHSVLSIFQDSKGNMWVGTDGDGLTRISKKDGVRSFKNDPGSVNSLSSNVITSIGEDQYGNILVGTYAGGLNIIDPVNYGIRQVAYALSDPKTPSSSNIWEIYRDSRDRIWLGLLGSGLDLYDPVQGTFYNMGPNATGSKRVDHSNVMVILEDSDGDIWFGTEGLGLNILDRQSGKMIKPLLADDDHILHRSMVRSLFQDRHGQIWIGTEGEGLFILNEKSGEVRAMSTDDGLPDMIIQGIQEDSRGNMWISTGNGLCRYNPMNGQINIYFRSDGLTANEYNSDAMLMLDDGRILAGSIKGLDVYNPENMIFNQNIPKVVLTKLEVLNKEVKTGEEVNGNIILSESIEAVDTIRLTYKDKIFSLEFAALNYTHPEKCKFEYMLEGFETSFVETGAERRIATYSNLDPGSYIFRVRASNNDGKWGNNFRVLYIEVLPPFWARWWFVSILILMGILLFIRFYRARLSSIKKAFHQQQVLQEKRIMELENENLESELKKLTYIRVNRTRNLLNLKNRLSALSKKAKDSVRSVIEEIIGEIDEEISADKEWKYIEPQLDVTFNSFLSKLKEKHPDLSLAEQKIAAYVRMELSTKEMAEYMHKTVRAVENDRYRLRKKLNLAANDSLREYLSSL